MAELQKDFLFGDDLDAVLSLIEEDILEEAPYFDQEIVDNVSELPAEEDNCSFNSLATEFIYTWDGINF